LNDGGYVRFWQLADIDLSTNARFAPTPEIRLIECYGTLDVSLANPNGIHTKSSNTR
jgi:hypothetical protein